MLVIDVLSDMAIRGLGVGAKMVTDLEITVVPELPIAFELRVPVPQSVDALSAAVFGGFTHALPVLILGIVPGGSLDVLPDMKVNVFNAATTALDFVAPAPV